MAWSEWKNVEPEFQTQTLTKSYNFKAYEGGATFDFEFNFPEKVVGITECSDNNLQYAGVSSISMIENNKVRVEYNYDSGGQANLELSLTAIGY